MECSFSSDHLKRLCGCCFIAISYIQMATIVVTSLTNPVSPHVEIWTSGVLFIAFSAMYGSFLGLLCFNIKDLRERKKFLGPFTAFFLLILLICCALSILMAICWEESETEPTSPPSSALQERNKTGVFIAEVSILFVSFAVQMIVACVFMAEMCTGCITTDYEDVPQTFIRN